MSSGRATGLETTAMKQDLPASQESLQYIRTYTMCRASITAALIEDEFDQYFDSKPVFVKLIRHQSTRKS